MGGKIKKIAKYQSWAPYCQQACPLGNRIREWLALVQAGRTQEAWEILADRNPFPAIMGRICYHFCEKSCRRGCQSEGADAKVALTGDPQAVAIAQVERWLGDQALLHHWPLPGRAAGYNGASKVLVIGAGPAGLSAAYQLARAGILVTVWEQSGELGGEFLRTIPSFRLPPEIARRELARVANYPGINVIYHKRFAGFSDPGFLQDAQQYAAVILATGASVDRQLGQLQVPTIGCADSGNKSGINGDLGDGGGADTGKSGLPILTLGDFLMRAKKGWLLPTLGERLAVYGGGNSAMDAARVARRLGVREVIVIYHRSRACMPAFQEEITQALAEGVQLMELRSIERTEGARQLVLQLNRLDDAQRPHATGVEERLAVDSLVLALGQQPELALYPEDDFGRSGNFLAVNATGRTARIGVWAIGDLVGGPRNATAAIAGGRKAALDLLGWLAKLSQARVNSDDWQRKDSVELCKYISGDEWAQSDPAAAGMQSAEVFDAKLVDFLHVHPERCQQSAAERVQQYQVPPELAVQDLLTETGATISDVQAQRESGRCYSCGSCKGCGNCATNCPKRAISLDDHRHLQAIDGQKCIGCGICTKKCPCGVLQLVELPQ